MCRTVLPTCPLPPSLSVSLPSLLSPSLFPPSSTPSFPYPLLPLLPPSLSASLSSQETLDALLELYSNLNCEDLFVGLWTERCRFPETAIAVAYESQGLFEQAQEAYESAIQRARELHNVSSAPPTVLPEYKLWEEHWCR